MNLLIIEVFVRFWIAMTQVLLYPSKGITNVEGNALQGT